jgi:hypothetical protein
MRLSATHYARLGLGFGGAPQRELQDREELQ